MSHFNVFSNENSMKQDNLFPPRTNFSFSHFFINFTSNAHFFSLFTLFYRKKWPISQLNSIKMQVRKYGRLSPIEITQIMRVTFSLLHNFVLVLFLFIIFCESLPIFYYYFFLFFDRFSVFIFQIIRKLLKVNNRITRVKRRTIFSTKLQTDWRLRMRAKYLLKKFCILRFLLVLLFAKFLINTYKIYICGQ